MCDAHIANMSTQFVKGMDSILWNSVDLSLFCRVFYRVGQEAINVCKFAEQTYRAHPRSQTGLSFDRAMLPAKCSLGHTEIPNIQGRVRRLKGRVDRHANLRTYSLSLSKKIPFALKNEKSQIQIWSTFEIQKSDKIFVRREHDCRLERTVELGVYKLKSF